MKIQRDFYLKQLIDRKHNGLIKTITGLRRSGKSFLLFELFNSYLLENNVREDHIIKIQLDELSNQPLLNNKKLFKYIKSKVIDNEQYYVLIDEIQNVKDFEPLVIELSRCKNIDIYITGSNSKIKTSELDTVLRGKDDPIHVYPLSFDEYCQAFKDKNEAFWQYCKFGGLPYTTYLNTDEQKRQYLNRLLNETYIKDILEHNRINNKTEVSEILDVLSTSVGSLINSNNISNTFLSVKHKKIKYSTIDKYINYFEKAFLINKVQRYDLAGKKLIGSNKKYYFEDIGLRNARVGFKTNDLGHIIENIVYNELKLRGFDVNVGIITSRQKNKSTNKIELITNEIDFIAYKGSNKTYIQVTTSLGEINSNVYKREVQPLLNISDSYKKIIITTSNLPTSLDNDGIQTINIIDFLLDKQSI